MAEEKYKKYSFGTKRDRSFRWNAVFGESTAVIPQKRHTIMPFRVLYKLWERGDTAWKESGEIRSVTSGGGRWWQKRESPGVRPRDIADVHKTPLSEVEDVKVYGTRSETLEQLRLSVEQYLRRVGSVSPDTVDRVEVSFLERVRLCCHREGAHIEHMLM